MMNGLVAGGFVAILSIAFIIGAWGAIEQRAMNAGYAGDGGLVDWMSRWTVIAIGIGLAASFMFQQVSARLDWINRRYLVSSVLLMVILDLLAFLPIYSSSVHVYPIAYLGLNTIFCLGFGALIPRMSILGYHGRSIL